MGLGKTTSTLYVLDLLKLMGEIGDSPTLVVGPMRVARDTWPDEVAKWKQFETMRIMPLGDCTPKEREKRLKSKCDIFTISYELLPWLVEYYLAKWPFAQVVADESDRLKSFREKRGGVSIDSKKAPKGKRAFQIGRVAHTLVKRWINLTGTPSPNGYKDLWGQQWFVDRGATLGRTYSAFTQRWFRQTHYGSHKIELMPHSKEQIDELLKATCLTVDPKDYFDLREPIVRSIEVKLPAAAKAIYKKLENELFATLASGETVEVFNAAALANKCLQLANGAVYTEYPSWTAVHDEKIEAIRSVLAESGAQPILLSYSFKSDLARIKAAFPRAVELKTVEGMRAFRAGDAPIGLAHPASLGHGIDGLQHVTNVVVFYGHDWNLGTRMQMIERIGPMRQLQAGFERPVYVYNIIAKGTLDEVVLEAHRSKRSAQDSLLEAMKCNL